MRTIKAAEIHLWWPRAVSILTVFLRSFASDLMPNFTSIRRRFWSPSIYRLSTTWIAWKVCSDVWRQSDSLIFDSDQKSVCVRAANNVSQLAKRMNTRIDLKFHVERAAFCPLICKNTPWRDEKPIFWGSTEQPILFSADLRLRWGAEKHHAFLILNQENHFIYLIAVTFL